LKTVSAAIDGIGVTQTAPVTVTAGAVSVSQSTVAAAPPTIAAGSGSATITVTAKDANGNPIVGATVVLAATGTGNTLSQPVGPTEEREGTTRNLRYSAAEEKAVSAKNEGVGVSQRATVTV